MWMRICKLSMCICEKYVISCKNMQILQTKRVQQVAEQQDGPVGVPCSVERLTAAVAVSRRQPTVPNCKESCRDV